MNFKVGNKVKIIKNTGNDAYNKFVGSIGKVIDYDNYDDTYKLEIQGCNRVWWNDYELELVSSDTPQQNQSSIQMDLQDKDTTIEILEKLIDIAEKNTEWSFVDLINKTSLNEVFDDCPNEFILDVINKYISKNSFKINDKVKIINGQFKGLDGVITDIDTRDIERQLIVKVIGGKDFSSFEAYLSYDDVEKIA